MAQKKKPTKKRPQKTRVQQMVADLESLAGQLRKRVTEVAAQVEKYVSQVRKELGWKPVKAKGKKAATKKRPAKAGKKTSA